MFKTAVLTVCLLAPCLAKLSPHAQSVLKDSLSNPGRYTQNQLEDGLLSVPDLITKYGYPLEIHSVTTQDGYILEMHRIPHGRDQAPGADRPVVFLMHGLLSSSGDYILLGPEKSLGYMLAEEGFDVWLGNARGNYYSRRHISRNPDSLFTSFWDFSWEEIGRFDVSAMVDYALHISGQKKLHYVGYSQGTTVFFVLNALRPEYNEKFASANLFAPVAFMDHFPSDDLASAASHTNILYGLGSLVGMNEIFPRGEVIAHQDGQYKCVANDILLSFLCDSLVPTFEAAGNPVLVGHFPAGAALKQVAHYGQTIDSGRFRRWDYGSLQNLLHYGNRNAPEYDLRRVTAKIVLHYSLADTLVGEEDVLAAQAVLPNSEVRKVERVDFTHYDFGYAADAKELLYDYVVDFLKEYQQNM